VIDLRRCLGGDGTLNAGLLAAVTSATELNQPGRIAVLTSRQTHSAAVMLVSDLEQQTTARFYGQPTADRPNHHGETNVFVTPNSQLPIIHASEYYQTSTPDDDRRNRTPDVAIPYRFSDYIAGRDPVLATALTDMNGQ
jgi:C-terminal processing protease CtpA/Prc